MKRLMVKFRRLMGQKGFTMVEVTMAAVIIAFAAAGVWGVYWSVVNAYYVEQKGSAIQAEGDRLLDMIANGGYAGGRRVHGLSSMVPVEGYPAEYPNVGPVDSVHFPDLDDSDPDLCKPGTVFPRADYRIEFALDCGSGNTRWAEYTVQLYECDMGGPEHLLGAKAVLWFRLTTEGTDKDVDKDHNYNVKLSENLLQRTAVGADCGDYSMTWFKAQLLPKDPETGRYTGIKVSFYLHDSSQPVSYDCDLNRELISPTGNPDQDRTLMGAIPYPKYFSTTVHFPNGG